MDLADLVGLHLVMSQIAGKGQLKFMIAGVGWASAELIMTGYVERCCRIECIKQFAVISCCLVQCLLLPWQTFKLLSDDNLQFFGAQFLCKCKLIALKFVNWVVRFVGQF